MKTQNRTLFVFAILIIAITFLLVYIYNTRETTEIKLLESYNPSSKFRLETIEGYTNPFLEDQKLIKVFRLYSKETCVFPGKVSTAGKPETYYVFVDKWTSDKLQKYEDMQTEVDEIANRKSWCYENCTSFSCSQEESQKYSSLMIQQRVINNEEIPICIQKCNVECNEKYSVENYKYVTPYARSDYLPIYSSSKYSLYIFHSVQYEEEVFNPPSNANKCSINEEENKILNKLCEKGLLFYPHSQGDSLIDNCDMFKL